MLSRMIDRADDFCKHGPATDSRSIVREEAESLFTDHWSLVTIHTSRLH